MAAGYSYENEAEVYLDTQMGGSFSASFTADRAGTYTLYLTGRSYEENHPQTATKKISTTVVVNPAPHIHNTNTGPILSGTHTPGLGHNSFYVCTADGYYTFTNNYTTFDGCTDCFPSHTHSYGSAVSYESNHPHAGYESCSCGVTRSTGTYKQEIWEPGTPSATHPHFRTDICKTEDDCTATKTIPDGGKYTDCTHNDCYPHIHNTNNGPILSGEHTEGLGHNTFYACDAEGYKTFTNNYTTFDGCTVCFPPPHKHSYDSAIQYKPAHPHAGYRTCSCGEGGEQLTGSNKPESWTQGTPSVTHPHNRTDICKTDGCTTSMTVAYSGNYPGCTHSDCSLPAPNAPGSVDVSPTTITTSGFTVTWGSVANATSYQIKLNSGEWKTSNGTLSHTYTGLTPNTLYTVEVRALIGTVAGPARQGGATTAAQENPIDEVFNYNSTNYNAELATRCAEYAMLAYDDMWYNEQGYIDIGSDKRKNIPTLLIAKLKAGGFTVSDGDAKNYSDNDPHNVSYVLANKQVLVNGQKRTLVAVVIRGTDRWEWQGNMDITGASYDPAMNDHYSFKEAEKDLRTNSSNGLTKYLSEHGITNPIYLITGHSRGAAVANLLAETLNNTVGTSNVFAYTFATPNVTKTPNLSRSNIYNFCFEDDFVPQVPLADWGYGKHGKTFTKIAKGLYNNNMMFGLDMERFLWYSRGILNVNFELTGTQSLLSHVSNTWKTVQDYYQTYHTTNSINPLSEKITLYQYFREHVALAAMNDTAAKIALFLNQFSYFTNSNFKQIAQYFVDGSEMFLNYIENAHHAFTYYTAVKYGLFN